MSETKPKPKQGNPLWQKGVSGNPAGRPKGKTTKQAKLMKLLDDDGEGVINTVIEAAKSGDMTAATIVVNRILPLRKAEAEKVNFQFDPSDSLAGQVESVLAAIASGDVAPDSGKQIIELIGSLGAIRQAEQFEERLSALEVKHVN